MGCLLYVVSFVICLILGFPLCKCPLCQYLAHLFLPGIGRCKVFSLHLQHARLAHTKIIPGLRDHASPVQQIRVTSLSEALAAMIVNASKDMKEDRSLATRASVSPCNILVL